MSRSRRKGMSHAGPKSQKRNMVFSERRSCGKLVFSTRKKAIRYIQSRMDRDETTEALREYQCDRCEQWHVTSRVLPREA